MPLPPQNGQPVPSPSDIIETDSELPGKDNGAADSDFRTSLPLLASTGVFVLALAAYLSVGHDGAGGGGGELLAVTCSGGVASPPG